MPCIQQPHLIGDLHRCSAPTARERAAGNGQVDRARGLDEPGESFRPSADGCRQLAQDPLDLVALGPCGLGEAVVQLDDVERLDEERLPGRRCVVHDAGNAAPRARLHREHGSAGTFGDERLLQMRLQGGRP